MNRPDSEGGYLPESSYADAQEARGLVQCDGCRSWLEPEQVAGKDVNLVFGACCWEPETVEVAAPSMAELVTLDVDGVYGRGRAR